MHVCIRVKRPWKDETNVNIGYSTGSRTRKWEKRERGFHFGFMSFYPFFFFYHTCNFYNETAS